jgi:hypothetical protein
LNSLLNKLIQLPTNRLTWLLAAIGVLIAMQINYIQHGWINNDSVLYFEAARLFALGEWQQGFKLFPWPLYSGLIALVHTISGFSLHFSAQILNVLFFGIATHSFLKLIRLCGGDNLTLLCGALLLFSSQYIVGDALQMLLRDQGFWAFFLTGIVFFVRFYRSLSWTDAIAWQLAMITAMLFRVEGITYLLALPFVLLLNKNLALSTRGFALLKAHSVNLSAGLIVASYLFLKGLPVSNLGRLQEIFTTRLLEDLTRKFMQRSEIMANDVLGNFLDQFASEGLLLTFIFIMLAKTISSAGWITAGLAAYTIRLRQQLLNHDAWRILTAVMAIALIDMFLIILKVFVLSGRYVVPLTLILITLAAFGLSELFHRQQKWPGKKRWLVYILVVVLALGMVKNILPKRAGHNYQQDAVAWVKSHNPDNLPVFYDSSRVRYYAAEPFIGTWMDVWQKVTEATEDGSIHKYEFLLISQEDDEEWKSAHMAEKLPDFMEVHRAGNRKGKKFVVVYQKNS